MLVLGQVQILGLLDVAEADARRTVADGMLADAVADELAGTAVDGHNLAEEGEPSWRRMREMDDTDLWVAVGVLDLVAADVLEYWMTIWMGVDLAWGLMYVCSSSRRSAGAAIDVTRDRRKIRMTATISSSGILATTCPKGVRW